MIIKLKEPNCTCPPIAMVEIMFSENRLPVLFIKGITPFGV